MSEWQTGSAPKDGSILLGVFKDELWLVRWESVNGCPPEGWAMLAQHEGGVYIEAEPRLWMQINLPEGIKVE